MRRTSAIVVGFDWHECPEATTSSDSAIGAGALAYFTRRRRDRRRADRPARRRWSGGDAGGDRHRTERADERVARRHVVDRARHRRWRPSGLPFAISAPASRPGSACGDGAGELVRSGCRRSCRLRRREEDHAPHEGQRLYEHHVVQQLAARPGQRELGERLLADRVPEHLAAVDHRHLREQTALAWPITTMRCSAGSVPSGSRRATAAVRSSRRPLAEKRIGFPES